MTLVEDAPSLIKGGEEDDDYNDDDDDDNEIGLWKQWKIPNTLIQLWKQDQKI